MEILKYNKKTEYKVWRYKKISMLLSTVSAVVAVLDNVKVVPELRVPWHVQVYMLLNAEGGMYLRSLSYTYICVCVFVYFLQWLIPKQHRPTWEVKGSSASQKFPEFFSTERSLCFHNSTPLLLILSQIKPVYDTFLCPFSWFSSKFSI